VRARPSRSPWGAESTCTYLRYLTYLMKECLHIHIGFDCWSNKNKPHLEGIDDIFLVFVSGCMTYQGVVKVEFLEL